MMTKGLPPEYSSVITLNPYCQSHCLSCFVESFLIIRMLLIKPGQFKDWLSTLTNLNFISQLSTQNGKVCLYLLTFILLLSSTPLLKIVSKEAWWIVQGYLVINKSSFQSNGEGNESDSAQQLVKSGYVLPAAVGENLSRLNVTNPYISSWVPIINFFCLHQDC